MWLVEVSETFLMIYSSMYIVRMKGEMLEMLMWARINREKRQA